MSSTLYAGSPTNKDMNINATVVESCVTSNGGEGSGDVNIILGEYNTIGAEETSPVQSMGNFDFACSKNSNVDLEMNNGNHADGENRRMSNGSGEYLTYEVYKDAGYTSRWGTGVGNCLNHTTTTSASEQIMIYVKVPEGQDASVGTYTDNLTLTIAY